MIIVPKDGKKRRKKKRIGRSIRASRKAQVNYRRSLERLLKSQLIASSELVRLITGGASKQAASLELARLMRASKTDFDNNSERLANNMVESLSEEHKRVTQNMIARAIGVDWTVILDGEEVAGEIELRKTKNVSLIESIGNQHWDRISQAIEDNYAGRLDKPLTQTIREIGGVSKRRAHLIARDQTAKFASSLNEVRQKENGIEEYRWRNSRDQRVVGNPAGLYPKGNAKHGNHWIREGKIYKWSKPPTDGHPGIPIQCRCTAEPIIDLEKLKAQYA